MVIALISTGAAALTKGQLDEQDSQTTPPMKMPASSPTAEFSGGLLQFQDNLDKLGMEKIAEMTAIARHSEMCPEVPREWSAAFIVLMMAATPTEEQVEAQECKMLALRDKIGQVKWCQLHSVEMHEAYLIYRFMTHR